MTDTTCRICGSKDIYCIQETSLVSSPWAIVHLAYCEKCANDIELFELFMRNQKGERMNEHNIKEIEEYEEDEYESDLREESLAKREIKSCPFCGKDAEVKHYKANGNDWWYIACNHCKIAIDPLFWNIHRTKEEIIEIWNKRAKE